MPEHKIVITFDTETNRIEVPEAPFGDAVTYFGMLNMAAVVMTQRLVQAEQAAQAKPLILPQTFCLPGTKPS